VVLDLIKGFLCIYWDDQVVFVFVSVNVLHYIYRFVYVKSPPPSLGCSWFGHGKWSVWYVLGFGLPLVYWGYLHWCSLRRLAYSSLFWMCLFLVLR
jgi:hypothetical protein